MRSRGNATYLWFRRSGGRTRSIRMLPFGAAVVQFRYPLNFFQSNQLRMNSNMPSGHLPPKPHRGNVHSSNRAADNPPKLRETDEIIALLTEKRSTGQGKVSRSSRPRRKLSDCYGLHYALVCSRGAPDAEDVDNRLPRAELLDSAAGHGGALPVAGLSRCPWIYICRY